MPLNALSDDAVFLQEQRPFLGFVRQLMQAMWRLPSASQSLRRAVGKLSVGAFLFPLEVSTRSHRLA